MIIGVSPAVQRARDLVTRYACTRLPILLVGPTGAGKELLARDIHRQSGRGGSLVDVNCGALPRDMAESLLFGHVRGAFTGAHQASKGFVTLADGGTLFLDELGSLTLDLQAKFLRVLETGEVPVLGNGVACHADFRTVAAAQETLPEGVGVGTFRRDLFQRLAGVVIELPPLIERMDDVVPLAQHFAAAGGRVLEPEVAEVLQNYVWPGNVRELRFAIERAGGLVSNGTLSAASVAEAIALGAPKIGRQAKAAASDRGWLLEVSRRNAFDAKRIANELGCRKTVAYERLKRAGISLRVFRNSAGIPSADPEERKSTADPLS